MIDVIMLSILVISFFLMIVIIILLSCYLLYALVNPDKF